MKRSHTFRQRLVLVLTAVIVLVVPSASFAQSPSEVTALARYYPADTILFAGIRTDDAYFSTLDAVLDRLNRATGGSINIPGRIQDLLDLVLGELIEGGTFQNSVRTWLGSSAAVGITDLAVLTDSDESNDVQGYLAAAAITDRAAAQAFIEEVVIPQATRNASQVETLEGAGYTGYELLDTNGDLVYFVLFDEVLFFSASDVPLPLDGFPVDTLDSLAAFTSGVDALPADVYNIVAYIDTPTVLGAAAQAARNAPGVSMDNDALSVIESAVNAAGATVIGAVTFADRTLALDAVQNFSGTGVMGITAGSPVDPAFARFIPANTPLVIHATDLNSVIDQLLRVVETAAAQADPEADAAQQIRFGIAVINTVLGLDLQEDVLSWMTGDFALVAGLGENFPATADDVFTLSSLPLEFGLIVEATNATQAETVFDGLRTTLEQSAENNPDQLAITESSEAGQRLLVAAVQTPDLPFPVELAVGLSDQVFAIGTAQVVQHALNPVNSLADDPLFNEAAANVLPNASQVWYLAGEPLQPLVTLIGSDESQAEQAEGLQTALTVFHSSSISTTITADGSLITRAALTLPE
ncbi:MAG: DUF3352 domain-containing protein [bacterium]|nr:DUF3352 domain-containing protein [bacterium]